MDKNDTGLRLTKAQVVLEEVRKTFVPETGCFVLAKDTFNLYIGDSKTPGGVLFQSNFNKETLKDLIDDPDIIQNIVNLLGDQFEPIHNIDLGNWDNPDFKNRGV